MVLVSVQNVRKICQTVRLFYSTQEAIRKVVSEDGIFGLYRGWTHSLATWLPYLSLYFLSHTKFRAQIDRHYGSEAAKTGTTTSASASEFSRDFGAGILAGSLSAAITYLPDALKTRVQSGWSDGGTRSVATHLRGLGLRIVWLAPNSALILSAYQYFTRMLQELDV